MNIGKNSVLIFYEYVKAMWQRFFLFMTRLIMLLQRISVYEWKNSQSNVNYLIRYSIKVNSFNLILWFFLHRGTIDLCINDLCTNVAFKCDICDEIFKKGVHLHALIWPFTNKARFWKYQSSISLDFPHTRQMFFMISMIWTKFGQYHVWRR